MVPITGVVPDPADAPSEAKRGAMTRALQYMGLVPGTRMTDIAVDNVFIGSCTNGRIKDLRAAAAVVKGRKVASHVDAMVSPGSTFIKHQAETEGLDRIFIEAGFQWRESGCSMCLGMNPDRVGQALRVHLERQLRGPPGPRRPPAPGQPRDGGGGQRPACGRAGDARLIRRSPTGARGHAGRESPLAASETRNARATRPRLPDVGLRQRPVRPAETVRREAYRSVVSTRSRWSLPL